MDVPVHIYNNPTTPLQTHNLSIHTPNTSIVYTHPTHKLTQVTTFTPPTPPPQSNSQATTDAKYQQQRKAMQKLLDAALPSMTECMCRLAPKHLSTAAEGFVKLTTGRWCVCVVGDGGVWWGL